MLENVLKEEVVLEKTGGALKDVDCEKAENWLKHDDMHIGMGTRRALTQVKEKARGELYLAMRTCLKTLAIYLQGHLPLTNAILRDLQCLQPVARKTSFGRAAIDRLCLQLKKVTKTDQFCDSVLTEWMLYCAESSIDDAGTVDGSLDICKYWKQIGDIVDGVGVAKYKSICFLAKSALTLSHSNAATERGFSVNNALVTKERGSLSEKTIKSIRIVKEAIRIHGSSVHIAINKDMLLAVKHAHSEYKKYVEQERIQQKLDEESKQQEKEKAEEIKQLQRKQQKFAEQLSEIGKAEGEQIAEEQIARVLIADATAKLEGALKSNNMQNMKIAQVMLTAGNEKLQTTAKDLQDIRLKKEKLQEKLKKIENAKKAVNDVKQPSKRIGQLSRSLTNPSESSSTDYFEPQRKKEQK
jgi:ribosomal protein L28